MANVNCKICDTIFYVKPCHQKMGYGKYCSRTCQFEAQKKGKIVNCHTCKKEIWKKPKELRASKSGFYFCSKSCQTKWRNKHFSGKLHPNWKDGEGKDYRELLLRNKECEQICLLCNNKDTRVLVVHHIDKNRKNNEVDNLIWLCSNCHLLVHHHEVKIP